MLNVTSEMLMLLAKCLCNQRNAYVTWRVRRSFAFSLWTVRTCEYKRSAYEYVTTGKAYVTSEEAYVIQESLCYLKGTGCLCAIRTCELSRSTHEYQKASAELELL
jgi:hypothetical protein